MLMITFIYAANRCVLRMMVRVAWDGRIGTRIENESQLSVLLADIMYRVEEVVLRLQTMLQLHEFSSGKLIRIMCIER